MAIPFPIEYVLNTLSRLPQGWLAMGARLAVERVSARPSDAPSDAIMREMLHAIRASIHEDLLMMASIQPAVVEMARNLDEDIEQVAVETPFPEPWTSDVAVRAPFQEKLTSFAEIIPQEELSQFRTALFSWLDGALDEYAITDSDLS